MSAAPTVASVSSSDAIGHRVIGVDLAKHEGVGERLDGFIEANLNDGLPVETGDGYDAIVAADVLEHTIDPDTLLADLVRRLAPNGSSSSASRTSPTGTPVAASPSDGSTMTHAESSIAATFASSPAEASNGSLPSKASRLCDTPSSARRSNSWSATAHRSFARLARAAGNVDRLATRAWPTMFGYQFLYELRRA